MRYKRPRGTQDIISPEIQTWHAVEKVFADTFERYGYQAIRTPIFETTDLFVRAVGEQTDIISKEMYTFTDRGGRSLTLRPENTASVIRAYLESGMHRWGGIVRLYYVGPMFRYDRPQAGRYRQFHQVGAEAIGGESPALDVEMIEMIMATLEKLAFRDLVLKLNSVGCPVCRGSYRELLKVSLSGFREELCRDCAERADRNPLRVFDCKHCGAVKTKLPTILSNLCDTCKQHYASVKTSLAEMGIPFEEDPYLVRGLDYYTRTSFEVLHSRLGAQNALCGGGRYDNLVEDCGGPSTPAVGFSAGLERIISVLPEHSAARESAVSGIDFYIICADEGALSRSLRAASLLREFGNVSSDFSMRSIKKQLRNARKGGARITVIADSSSRERLIWRDMAQRWQTDVPDNELLSFAKEHFEETKGDSS